MEGIELEIEEAKAAVIIGGIGFNPAPIARGHVITAEAVLDAE